MEWLVGKNIINIFPYSWFFLLNHRDSNHCFGVGTVVLRLRVREQGAVGSRAYAYSDPEQLKPCLLLTTVIHA